MDFDCRAKTSCELRKFFPNSFFRCLKAGLMIGATAASDSLVKNFLNAFLNGILVLESQFHCEVGLWLGGNSDKYLFPPWLILVDGDIGQLISQEILKHRVVIVGGFLIRMTFHG